MKIIQIEKNILNFEFEEKDALFPFNITALIENEKIILIDLAYKRFADHVKKYFEDKGYFEFEIYLTHHHEDHFEGMKSFPDAKIIASKNFKTDFQEHLQTDEILKNFVPEKSIEDLQNYKSENFEIQFIKIPGHNNCEFAFLINQKHLRLGDLLFFDAEEKLSLPYIDGHSYVDDYLESLEKLKALNIETLICGHGKPVSDKTEIIEHIEDLKFYLNRIKTDNDAELETCLKKDKSNFSGLMFHSNNLARVKAAK